MRNGRCRMHGGRSLFGCTAPLFRHGQHCKGLVDRIIGLGTASFSDVMHFDPERLRRVGRSTAAMINLFGGPWMFEDAARDRERRQR